MPSTANSVLEVTELDFGNIKDSLKTYLKSQSKFSDYDFEGSNINILLDILSYNTHYQTFYTNMVANEMFIDSAQLRNSVVSRAKELGYTPRSARGATATLSLTVTPSNTSISTVTVSKNTEFTTTLNDDTLTYVTPTATTIRKNANGIFTTTIDVVEGIPLTHKFTVSANTESYEIPNDNVDTRSLSVQVQTSSSDLSSTTYNQIDDLTTVSSETKGYFLEENDDNRYSLRFGDNVIGNKPISGNIIVVGYRYTNGTDGNGANTFTLTDGSIDGHSNVSFSVVSSAEGGAGPESIESIRFNAPKHFERQNRVVTESDYRRYLLETNGDFQDISVWGGEENSPKQYGKVYISVKPTIGTLISNTRKAQLVTDLEKRNVVSIDPVFADPEFLYVEVSCTVKYNPEFTDMSESQLKTAIINKILAYNTNSLGTFGKTFRYSKLVKDIDSVDSSILSNLTDVRMQLRLQPTIGVPTQYTLEFNNAFAEQDSGHIVHAGHAATVYTTDTFTFSNFESKFEDDGSGNVRIYRQSGSSKITLDSEAGDINYDTGEVVLPAFNPTAINSSGLLKVSAKPRSNDISALRNQIILIDEDDINVTMVQDSNA